jgi:pantetheine-phosphate adenylyltransferase
MKKILYPGSFDPITYGHMNIIEQACDLFDEVVIAVMNNPRKRYMFNTKERVELISKLYKDNPQIKIVSSEGATIDVAMENECRAIVRGLRTLSDFEYEIQMTQVNKQISNNMINTIGLFAEHDYENISSSMVKEIIEINKDVSSYIHPIVEQAMRNKLSNQ